MRTRVCFEADLAHAARWITDAGYPYEITEGDLAGRCVVLRAERGGDTVAYLWLHWAEEIADTVVVHACAAAARRGRWMDPTVVARVFAVSELMGARLLASEPLPGSPPSLHRLYRRLGFAEPRPGLFVSTV